MPVINAAFGARSAVRAGQYDTSSASLTRQICMRLQMAKKRKTSQVAAVMLATSLPATASEYQSLRFEEDWRANCSKITPKCWRIGKTAALTLGADARMRAQGYWPLVQTSGERRFFHDKLGISLVSKPVGNSTKYHYKLLPSFRYLPGFSVSAESRHYSLPIAR